MLVIEGPDMCGKTTLCHKLLADEDLQNYGFIYKHFSKPPPGFRSPYSYIRELNGAAVADRFHLSEVVYASVRGDKSLVSPKAYNCIQQSTFTVLLCCEPDWYEELMRRHIGDRDEMYTLEQNITVNAKYYSMFLWMVKSQARFGLLDGEEYAINMAYCLGKNSYASEASEVILQEYKKSAHYKCYVNNIDLFEEKLFRDIGYTQ